MNRNILLALIATVLPLGIMAQTDDDDKEYKPWQGIAYKAEVQVSASSGKTPLWLNANKYGLSSLDETNGYVRGAVERPISRDEGKKWGLGYGVDVAVPVNYTSNVVVQQAYAEGRWLHGTLTIGAKQYPMEMKNQQLSSGSQTLGINARPVPQVRLALADWWTVPLTKGWLHLKGHIAFGRMTDDGWQHDFTARQTRYTDDVLYHSKAGYLMLGNEEVFSPWSLELGLEMVSQFGGTTYNYNGETLHNSTNLRAYWQAFVPSGSDSPESTYKNKAGNQLGSWVGRLKYESDWNMFAIYFDKYFEDLSSMFQLDYDGYGHGDEWDVKKDHRWLIYDFKDWMLGFEYRYKANSWLNNVVVEYLYTKYQSGPIYHDHTNTISDHIGGNDNFYNHYIYPGYQHWGQVMGNPLYRSPIYNTDGTIEVKDNRFWALHLGLGGQPNYYLSYRLLATWQEGFGTYGMPYLEPHHNVSLLAEAAYDLHSLKHKWINGTALRLGYGMDFGKILGGINYGFQFTITKSGIL